MCRTIWLQHFTPTPVHLARSASCAQPGVGVLISGEVTVTYKEKYHEYLKSEAWQKLREKAFKRSAGFCEVCGLTAECVHHCFYPETLDADNTNLHAAICNKCHDLIHNNSKVRRCQRRPSLQMRATALAQYRMMYGKWWADQITKEIYELVKDPHELIRASLKRWSPRG